MTAMRLCCLGLGIVALAGLAAAQTGQPPTTPPLTAPTKSQTPSARDLPASELPANEPAPRSDDAESAPPSGDDRNFSSSRASIIDLSPPKGDLKEHPDSAAAMAMAMEEENAADADVQEFHPWNPMKALKDVEVGDYYFKRKNYRAALDRYQEALFYKEKDAVATFRLAVCQEQLGDRASAGENYAAYLKILPHGPFAEEAQESMDRLSAEKPKVEASGKKETAAKEASPEKP